MPYHGGSAMHAGANYQNWFLTLQFSYAFFEPAYDIFPEILRTKSEIVDDICIKHKKEVTFYSLKYRPPSNNLHWNVSNLSKAKIFEEFKKQYEANPNCNIFLVSECNCYLFAEVFKRARNASSQHDIEKYLDNSKEAIKAWNEAKEKLNYNDIKLIQFAKKVGIKTLPIEEIEYLVKHRFSNITDEKRIEDLLFKKASTASSLKTHVNKFVLNTWFDENSIRLK